MKPDHLKETWCIIPARGGSKGIPLKNILPLNGKPLIGYSIEYARTCKAVDRIIVSTDSGAIAEVAREYGAFIPEMRPREISSDTAKIADAYWHGVDAAIKKLSITPKKIIVLYPTSPFRPQFLLEEAITELDFSIIYKVYQIISNPRGYYQKSPDGTMKRVYSGGGLKQMGLAFGTRYFPPEARPYPDTYDAFLEYTKSMQVKGGGTSLRVIDTHLTPWGIDIDSQEDVQLAEWFLDSTANASPAQTINR